MPRMTQNESLTVLGDTYRTEETRDGSAAVTADPVVPAAKVGALTTRTDNDTGTLTMSGGHGIQTGDIIDLYWAGGSRRTVTVGTVATNSVPIDGGTGDNLPTADTPVTVGVREEKPFGVTGDNVITLVAKVVGNAADGWVTLTEDDGTTVVAALRLQRSAGGGYVWRSTSGVDNPIAGGTVVKAFLSHGDSSGARTVRAVAIL